MRAELIQDPSFGSVVLNMEDWVNRCKRNSVLSEPPKCVLHYT